MQGSWTSLATLRRWLAAFAVVALLVHALVPQGYMVSSVGGAPGIAICTGHGALVLSGDHGQPTKPARPSHEAPCAFAGHGVGAAPPPGLALEGVRFVIPVGEADARVLDLLPGRGLAAPPPPAQGPPLRSV